MIQTEGRITSAARRLSSSIDGSASGCMDAVESVCGRPETEVQAATGTEGSSGRPGASWPMLGVDVLDGVASLVDKSLLQHDDREDGEPGVWLLETIREYALERLEASGEAATLRRRHVDYYLPADECRAAASVSTRRRTVCSFLGETGVHESM